MAVFATTLILKGNHFQQGFKAACTLYLREEKSLTIANAGIMPSPPQLEVKL